MTRLLHKSINTIKQKVKKCDEVVCIFTLFIIQWPKKYCRLMML